MTNQQPESYHAYLLRCWQEAGAAPGTPSVWRFSLEDARTRTRRGFDSLASLCLFLESMLQDAIKAPESQETGRFFRDSGG